jgi:hypothetical protein
MPMRHYRTLYLHRYLHIAICALRLSSCVGRLMQWPEVCGGRLLIRLVCLVVVARRRIRIPRC